ncbi:MAG TPA: cadherin-like domain-containing protein, partial [Symbiobacteriaceae bacterium]|nr:cadherin-like domain-containing protein [Symbiobacteriaceae bacterium]
TNPTNGTVTVNANGSFTYTPNANYNGADSFTYKANDGALDSNVVTVTINVTPVNDAPVAVNDTYSTPEDTPLTIAAPGILSNDTDVEGSALTVVVGSVTSPSKGTVVVNANGSFTYTPTTANYNGTDSFTYRVTDGAANSNVATVTINITPVNDAPVAANDTYTTAEDTPLVIAAPGVLSNDTDVDGPALTAVLVSPPASGTFTLNANGSFNYTPASNFSGSVTFTYRASDGTLTSNLATVTINVTPVNDAPVANNDTYSVLEDQTLNVAATGVLTNDTDPDGPSMTAQLVSNVSNGSLTLNGNGSFTYTPNPDFYGSDSFTYRVSDGTATSNVATVTITVTNVNDAPTVSDATATVISDNGNTVGVTITVTDVDGDTTFTGAVGTWPSLGTLVAVTPFSCTVTGGVSTCTVTVTYDPTNGAAGPDSFTYRVQDPQGAWSSYNMATITVQARTTLTLNALSPSTAQYNDTVPFTATLRNAVTNAAIGGESVDFSVNGSTVGSGTTNGAGTATYNYQVVVSPPSATIRAAFNGSTYYVASPAPASRTLTVTKDTPTLTVAVDGAQYTDPFQNITATLLSNGYPVSGATLTIQVNTAGTWTNFGAAVTTDAAGQVTVAWNQRNNWPITGTTPQVRAVFAGNTNLNAVTSAAVTPAKSLEDNDYPYLFQGNPGASNNFQLDFTWAEAADGSVGYTAGLALTWEWQISLNGTTNWTTCGTVVATPSGGAGTQSTYSGSIACKGTNLRNRYGRMALSANNYYASTPSRVFLITDTGGVMSVGSPVVVAGGATVLSATYSTTVASAPATPVRLASLTSDVAGARTTLLNSLTRETGGSNSKPSMPPGLVGKPIAFYINDVFVGEAPLDENGAAHLDYQADLPAGTYEIKALFKGTSEHGPASGTGTLTVQARQAELLYQGDTHSTSGSASLQVSVVEKEGQFDLTKAGTVRFTVKPPDGDTLTLEALVGPEGTVSRELHNLSPGSYQINISLGSGGYYTAPPIGVELTVEDAPPPTAPVTRPTEPGTSPTEPVTPPTDPVTPPTEPLTPPAAPVTPPTAPVTPPTAPVTPPTAPVTPPAAPVTPPTAPVTPPAAPVTPPAAPVTPPAEPVTPPAEPVTPPAAPVTAPTDTVTAPTDPVLVPVNGNRGNGGGKGRP